MFTSRTKFEERIWLVRHVQLMSRFVSRKFWDILVYSCSLIAKVSQRSSLKNRFLPHHMVTPLQISATVSTIDWSLLSIHIQCASYCVAPSINPTWNPNLTFVTVLVCLCDSFEVCTTVCPSNMSQPFKVLQRTLCWSTQGWFLTFSRPLTPHSRTDEHNVQRTQRFRGDILTGHLSCQY